MVTRRRDGEYRFHEYDPETVRRLAVELLQAFARDPQAAQIADLDVYLPDVRQFATDQERDDLADAIYEACGRATVTIPSEPMADHPSIVRGESRDVLDATGTYAFGILHVPTLAWEWYVSLADGPGADGDKHAITAGSLVEVIAEFRAFVEAATRALEVLEAQNAKEN